MRSLARLPIRIRIRLDVSALPDWLRSEARKADQGWFELTCPQGEKMMLLRRLAMLDGVVTDLHIDMPTLDQLYAHFLEQRAS